MLISRGDAATCLLRLPQIKAALHNPHLMLASRFKEDSGPTYDYQQLSRIAHHMTAGRQLILKDFDMIYGALYDMLNQCASPALSSSTLHQVLFSISPKRLLRHSPLLVQNSLSRPQEAQVSCCAGKRVEAN